MKKILIVGQGRHGKDTVAEILLKNHGRTFMSSSRFACEEFIYDNLKEAHGYATVDECYDDRHNHRDMWFELISDYNRDDPARLAKELLDKYDVYVGMRSARELEACKASNLFGAIIYVDASARIDYVEPTSSNEITEEDTHITMYNNESLLALESQVGLLVDEVLPYV